VDRFYNSGVFKKSIKALTKDSPFPVFEKLAELLQSAEKNGRIPRHKLYNLLYDFGGDKIKFELPATFC
jgi:hypothetical protein